MYELLGLKKNWKIMFRGLMFVSHIALKVHRQPINNFILKLLPLEANRKSLHKNGYLFLNFV